LQELLDLLEEEGGAVPMQVGDKYVFQELTPIDVNVSRAIIGPLGIRGVDRRNWFSQRRVALQALLKLYNERRW
jgi:hypothetical protein